MKKLLLVDGHSLIHRAFHAYPATLATATGEPTNAVYGFTNILLNSINSLKPTHVAVTFDLPAPTFRETMFVGYKQSRLKPDDDLIAQIPRVRQVVEALNIPIFAVAGYEADDVIGTLARQATKGKQVSRLQGYQIPKPGNLQPVNLSVVILTSDRDLMQLIRDDQVVVRLPRRGGKKDEVELWNETKFRLAWGCQPKMLVDYKALAGDPSDDIPGVLGVGDKTAKKLVMAFGDVTKIYLSLEQVREQFGESVAKKLILGQESAMLSQRLATIDQDVPIKLNWVATEVHGYDKEKVLKLFDELQFRSLINKLPNDRFEQDVQSTLF